jgi:uncharacterized protein (TIGR02679 family)
VNINVAADDARLQRLLGGDELATLRRRLRARFERGATGDEFSLSRLNSAERRALEGLLGRSVRSASSMRLRLSELDTAIARAGLARNLRAALEALDGPLIDRKAKRVEREQRWRDVLEGADRKLLWAFLADSANVALLRRLASGGPEEGCALLERAARVLARLPAFGLPLAQLAAETLGNAHALDPGQPVATLVLRACAWSPNEVDEVSDTPETAADSGSRAAAMRRNLWALAGVSVNELAAPALCLNLRAPGETPAGALAVRAAELGVPIHLSLKLLLESPPRWVHARPVYVCENSAVIAIAAQRFGLRSPPLVCTDGMPGAAQQALLRQLREAGALLRYHGDFDWPGIAIANFVIRSFGAAPWRFSAADYRACITGNEPPLLGRRVEASWDPRLAAAMAESEKGLHEESVIEPLMADLATATA